MEVKVVSGSNVQTGKDVVENLVKKTIIPNSITDLYTNDVWVRTFIHECSDIFGVPTTSQTCYSKRDRFMYTYGLMCITSAMRRMDSTWRGMHKKVDAEQAAWEFCRRFHEKYNDLVVPDPSTGPGVAASLRIGSKLSRSLPSGSHT
jgi:hypothetical protein